MTMGYLRATLTAAILLCLAGVSSAQTTQPADVAALQLRATQAFNRGDYGIALPMLQKLSLAYQGQPEQADRVAILQEQIRVCQKNQPVQIASIAGVTSTGNVSVTAQTPAMPPSEATGVDRKPHAAPKPGQTLDMTIKELGNFEYDAEHGSPIPTDVKGLSGSSIRLHGYMIPMDQAENISKFALVPSLFGCCFGQPPQIQHTIVVNCPKGKAVQYYADEIMVEGKLNVEEKKDDGFVVSLFEIEPTSVKPAPK